MSCICRKIKTQKELYILPLMMLLGQSLVSLFHETDCLITLEKDGTFKRRARNHERWSAMGSTSATSLRTTRQIRLECSAVQLISQLCQTRISCTSVAKQIRRSAANSRTRKRSAVLRLEIRANAHSFSPNTNWSSDTHILRNLIVPLLHKRKMNVLDKK